MKNILYVISILIICLATFLVIEFPDSGRYNYIAGMLFPIGFGLNFGAFYYFNEKKTLQKNNSSL